MQFRTTPTDSSGAPHILEHTVLCGSQRYPCRDPFFKMLNRSLSTFMNAFTGETRARPGLPGLSFGGGSPEAGVEFPISVWRLLMLNPLGKPHWG